MTNQELEQRLAGALSRTAPDDLEGVLSRCAEQKGDVISVTRKKKYPVMRNLVAACLTVALVGGGMIYQQAYAVTSIVSLDVNPSIELKVNKRECVLVCEALNAEAEAVLADMNGGADLEGTKLNVAVNAIVGTLMRNGYLDSISSAILISVEDGDQTRAVRLQQELTAEVDTVLLAQASEAAVFSQTVKKDVALEKQAKENRISTGKASLITQITERNHELTFEKLSALSVEELKDLLEAGAPGMPIGREAAVSAAKQYAGVSGLSSVQWEVDAELDDVPACYEVDLYISGMELEYAVDAYSSKVIRGTPVTISKNSSGAFPDSIGTNGEKLIGEDAALDAAVADFCARYPDLRSKDITNHCVELDMDDGKVRYDVKFYLNGYEVDYDIDAKSGCVLEWDADHEGLVAETKIAANGDVGRAKAMQIALAHAGLTESQTTRLQIEKDKGNRRMVYEIEFKEGKTEYEYIIDAATGVVLEHEKDRDD